MDERIRDVKALRKELGLPPAPEPAPDETRNANTRSSSSVSLGFLTIGCFVVIGPAIPLPLFALLANRPDQISKASQAYPLAILVGGMAAAAVGAIFALVLISLRKLAPNWIQTIGPVGRVVKSAIVSLSFSLVFAVPHLVSVIRSEKSYRVMESLTMTFSLFIAPTLICAFIACWWLLPKLSLTYQSTRTR